MIASCQISTLSLKKCRTSIQFINPYFTPFGVDICCFQTFPCVAVKVTLFKAFCQSFYTCSLWVNYTQKTINALRVQYNNAFRMLLGLPRYCSASGMFADARTDGFHAILRKRAASLLSRVRGSANGILSVIANRLDCPILWHSVRLHVN